jgi:hypothetical protein
MTAETRCNGASDRHLIPMVGKKYGHLTVLERVPRPPGRTKAAYVHVRCDCGIEYIAQAHHVRNKINCCWNCGRKVSAEANRARSTRLPSGRTWVEVAEASGVSLNTVTQRWLRGWSEEDLSLPVNGKQGRRARNRKAT